MNYAGEHFKDRARIVLRSFTGRGAMAVKELSEMTGLSVNQINTDRDTLRDGSIPFPRLAIYGSVFGAAFWSALIGPGGFAVIDVKPATICERHHLTETLNFASTFSVCLEDGIIDHQEARVLIPQARQRGAAQFQFAHHLERRVA